MSGMVECYLINNEGLQCDFSPAVTNTRVIFGKNQPFLCVEIEVSKYMFDSNDFWAERPHPEGTDPLARPNLIQNTTPIHIKTYGGEYDLIYTQTLNPNESTYVFLCYTKMWQSKTTEVSSLISDIVWSGQEDTYDSGVLSVTCNGLTSLVQIAGAFQPTAKAGSIHKNVQIIKPSKLNTLNVPTLTKTNIGSLRVLVPIYVDPDIPSDALVGYTEPTQDISFDDIQGTMRADTVYASILFDYSAPFSKQDLNNYYKGVFPYWVIPDIDAYIYHASTKVQQNVEGVMVESSSPQLDGILYCQGVEYVTGYGQTLFAWLSKVIGGYNGDELVIDKGYQMETSENILSQLNYTTEELAKYKADTEGRTYGDSIYKILPDTICYDLIKAVSVATNRHAYFADAPYLSSFEVSDFKPNSLSDLKIQYTPNDGSYAAYFIPYGETEPQQIILGSGVEYNDQGSTYLVGEQTAKSANASVTVKASDAGTDIAGMPVEVSIDTESMDGSKAILAQVAFNTLIENYHPSNTLSFIALENSSTPVTTKYIAYMTRGTDLPPASDLNEGKYYVRAGYDDVGLYLSTGTGWTRTQPRTGDTVTVYAPSNIYYFSFNGTSWDEYSYVSIVERHALFRPDTRCATLEDTRSHTTLSNVSLAYTVLSWPDCTTKYMFGDPVFQDTEETIAELQSIAKQSITNTSVSEALNKPYVTAAIGNIPLDQAGDDLTDFSGLILQKNDSTGVASMDGYMGGQRQARFSSDGAISSGVVTYYSPRSSDPTALTEAGDSVVMDRDGFHTRSWHLYPQTSPQFAYSDGYWVEETRIGVDGEISAGAGSVVLGHGGLTNYDSEGEPAYTLDDDGLKYKGQPIINSENGKIQLKVDGAAIDGNLRAVSITLPYVQIDNQGMRMFSKYLWDTESEQYIYPLQNEAGTNTYLQCSVGTNGVITAGAGAVKLDKYGVSTWHWAQGTRKLIDGFDNWNYDAAVLQCSMTTDGEITAGVGAVKLDADGLSTWTGQSQETDINNAPIPKWNYSNATRQCAVTTSGQFIAGNASNGWSILDNTGLKLYTKGADPTATGVNRNPIVWIDTDGYHMDNSRAYTSSTSQIEKATFNYGTWANYVDKDGDIKANVNLLSNARLNAGPVCRTVDNDGNTTAEYYSVCLHPNGLSTYSYEASGGIVNGIASGTVTTTEQCRIDTTGKIVAGGGAIKLDSTGLTTYDVVTTPSTPTQQCRVTNDGKFIAGNNLVTLSDTGLILGSNNDAGSMPTYISMNKESAITIFDTTVDPAVVIANTGSTFKNNVQFGSSINVSDRITLGTSGATINPATLSVSVSQRDGETVHTASTSFDSMVLSPTSGQVLCGTIDQSTGRFTSSFSSVQSLSTYGRLHRYNFTASLSPALFVRVVLKGEYQTPYNVQYASSKTTWPSWLFDFTAGSSSDGFPVYDSQQLRTQPIALTPGGYVPIYLSQDYVGTLYTVTYNSTTQQYAYAANTGLYSYSNGTYTAIPQNTTIYPYTTYYAVKHELSVASKVILDIPIHWQASASGTLNESYTATITYETVKYTAEYSQEEGIKNAQWVTGTNETVQQSSTIIATPGVASGNTRYFRLECPNVVNYSEGKLSGRIITYIKSLQVTIKLPLDRASDSSLLSFDQIGIGSLQSYAGGELFVSSGGLWGTTVEPGLVTSGGTSSIVLSSYGIAPIANTTYVKQYTTPHTVRGLKRITTISSTDPLPSSAVDGEILIIYEP